VVPVEILLTIMAGKKVTVMSPPQERAALSKALDEDLASVQRVVGAISAETADATMEGDRTMIFAAIVRLLPRGFLDLENMVKDRLREWTYEAGEEALAAMAPEERGASKLINQLTLYFQKLGEYDRAEPLMEEALAANRRIRGDDHKYTLISINNLGNLRKAKGDYAGAEPLLEEALAARQRTLGDDHPHTLSSINNLGQLREAKGDYAGAEPLYEEALAGCRRTLGDDDPYTLISISTLGSLLMAKGDYAGAESL
jgi:tetratricopeptide (TPR) repeat protein